MNTLREAIDEYVRLRRDLGFKLIMTEHWLRDFALFMENCEASFITLERALQWATQPVHAQPSTWAKRLMVVRLFARHRSALDPRTEIPPAGLLPHRPKRARPYLYTEGDIDRLLQAASALPPPNGLRGRSYACLLGLLAVTGLRIGEALALRGEDVDLEDGVLTLRNTKFDKSRLIPVHRSTQQALSTYARERDAHLGRGRWDHFFMSAPGKPLVATTVRRKFRELCHKIGLHGSDGCDEPRLHHFRHRFATETLLRWYRSGADVERRLPVLATYLGHAHVSETYWYLNANPALMAQALQRLEHRWEQSS